MKQIIKKINFIKVTEVILAIALTFAPLFVAQAQLNRTFGCDPRSGLNCSAGNNINELIRTVINWLLGIAFGVAVLFLIIGGFWYITSAGNEETAEKGRTTAINAIIGIVIIILAYVVINVVSNLVGNANVGSA